MSSDLNRKEHKRMPEYILSYEATPAIYKVFRHLTLGIMIVSR